MTEKKHTEKDEKEIMKLNAEILSVEKTIEEETNVKESEEKQEEKDEIISEENQKEEKKSENEVLSVEKTIEEGTDVKESEEKQEEKDEKDSENNDEDVFKLSDEDSDCKWYTLHVYSGSEKKVDRIIMEMKKTSSWGKLVEEIYTPIKKSSKVVRRSKAAKRVVKAKNLYPGYIFIKMLNQKEVVRSISNLPNVMGFLGGDDPIYLTSEEENNLKTLMEEGDKIVKLTAPFVISESVKIISGPFTDFIGTVQNVNEEKQRLKVIVTIFGRATPVEVDFIDAQPV